MKVTEKYTHMVYMNTLMRLYSMKQVAKAIVEQLNAEGDSVELHKTENAGFTMRRLGDSLISDTVLMDAMALAIASLLDDKIDEAMDYMYENYDLEYSKSSVDEDFVRDIFDFTRNGRLIYVDADL